jgi:hypothetical protein
LTMTKKMKNARVIDMKTGPRVSIPPPANSLTVLPHRSWAGLRGPVSFLDVEAAA